MGKMEDQNAQRVWKLEGEGDRGGAPARSSSGSGPPPTRSPKARNQPTLKGLATVTAWKNSKRACFDMRPRANRSAVPPKKNYLVVSGRTAPQNSQALRLACLCRSDQSAMWRGGRTVHQPPVDKVAGRPGAPMTTHCPASGGDLIIEAPTKVT